MKMQEIQIQICFTVEHFHSSKWNIISKIKADILYQHSSCTGEPFHFPTSKHNLKDCSKHTLVIHYSFVTHNSTKFSIYRFFPSLKASSRPNLEHQVKVLPCPENPVITSLPTTCSRKRNETDHVPFASKKKEREKKGKKETR